MSWGWILQIRVKTSLLEDELLLGLALSFKIYPRTSPKLGPQLLVKLTPDAELVTVPLYVLRIKMVINICSNREMLK